MGPSVPARARVVAHPLCARLVVTREHFIAYYPPGYVARSDGIRVTRGQGDAEALMQLRDLLDSEQMRAYGRAVEAKALALTQETT